MALDEWVEVAAAACVEGGAKAFDGDLADKKCELRIAPLCIENDNEEVGDIIFD